MRSSPAQHDLMGVKKRTTLPTAIAGNARDNIYEKRRPFLISVLCAPLGARTLDPNIKSVVLYQLS